MGKTEKKKPSVGRKILWNLAGILGLIVALAVGIHFVLAGYTRHGEEIDVPLLKGLTVDAAMQKIRAAGLRATLSDSVYTKEQAPNTIYSQSLTPGTHVKAGRVVHLTVNSPRPPMVTLPDLADNSSVREARMKLTVMGIKHITIEEMDGEKDWVYALKVDGKSAAAFQRVSSDARITLVVGNGSYSDETEEELDGLFDDGLGSPDDDYGTEITDDPTTPAAPIQ